MTGQRPAETGMSMKSWAGQEMSAMTIDKGDGTVELSISGRRSQSGVVLQLYDWGEAGSIARKVLAQAEGYLK